MSKTESDEGSSTINELLAELEKETLPEDSSKTNKTNDEDSGLAGPRGDKKIENPYKDKKNDDSNTYEFSDDKDVADIEW